MLAILRKICAKTWAIVKPKPKYTKIQLELMHSWSSTDVHSMHILLGSMPADCVLYSNTLDYDEFLARALHLVSCFRRQRTSHEKALEVISGARDEKRPFALYLRSFKEYSCNRPNLVPGFSATFITTNGENAEAFAHIQSVLPVIQFSNQSGLSSQIPSLITRNNLWKKTFIEVSALARVLIVDLRDDTGGIKWEIAQISSRGWTCKTIVLDGRNDTSGIYLPRFLGVTVNNLAIDMVAAIQEILAKQPKAPARKPKTVNAPLVKGFMRRWYTAAWLAIFHKNLRDFDFLVGFQLLAIAILLEDEQAIAHSLAMLGKTLFMLNIKMDYFIMFSLLSSFSYAKIGEEESAHFVFDRVRPIAEKSEVMIEAKSLVEIFFGNYLKEDLTFAILWEKFRSVYSGDQGQ